MDFPSGSASYTSMAPGYPAEVHMIIARNVVLHGGLAGTIDVGENPGRLTRPQEITCHP